MPLWALIDADAVNATAPGGILRPYRASEEMYDTACDWRAIEGSKSARWLYIAVSVFQSSDRGLGVSSNLGDFLLPVVKSRSWRTCSLTGEWTCNIAFVIAGRISELKSITLYKGRSIYIFTRSFELIDGVRG